MKKTKSLALLLAIVFPLEILMAYPTKKCFCQEISGGTMNEYGWFVEEGADCCTTMGYLPYHDVYSRSSGSTWLWSDTVETTLSSVKSNCGC